MQLKKLDEELKLDLQGMSSAERRVRVREFLDDPGNAAGNMIREFFGVTEHLEWTSFKAARRSIDASIVQGLDRAKSYIKIQSSYRKRCQKTSMYCKKICDSNIFVGVITFAIFIVAVLEGLSTDGYSGKWLRKINTAILVLFTLEVHAHLMRARAVFGAR